MRKLSLLTAVLLLSCVWAVAQTSPSSDSSQNPSSTQPSTQSPSSTTSPSSTSPTAQQPDTSSAASSKGESDKGNAIEGCLSGSAGSYTLTDASGATYQLAGDTSKLSDHVGHQVKIWGDTASASSGATSAGGTASATASQQTLNVKKVKMVSSTCSNK